MHASPKRQARLTGLLYLIIMATALYCEIAVRGTMIVHGDAEGTARNILAAEPRFRIAGVLDIITYVCDVGVATMLFVLTRPVSLSLASVAAAFRLAYSAMAGVLCFYWFHALSLLRGDGLEALSAAQRHALALSTLQLRDTGFLAALIFFGIHLALLGATIIKARYLPSWIGVLLLMAAVGYILNSTVVLVVPTISLGPWPLLPGLLGEGALTVYLLVVGVNQHAWPRADLAPVAAESASRGH